VNEKVKATDEFQASTGEHISAPDAAPGSRQRIADSDLLLAMFRTLIEYGDLSVGLRSALEVVCKFAGWDAGMAWLPTEDKERIKLSVWWQVDDRALSDFIRTCRDQSFLPNVGIVGRVWAQATAEWVSDLPAQDPEVFPLVSFATRAGIKAVLGVPMLHEDAVLGVLLFYTEWVKQEDEKLVQAVSRVASQLGFALHHKLSQEDLRAHEASLRRRRDELEIRVSERTVQLQVANEALRAEIFERKRVQQEMETRVRQQEAVTAIGARALSDTSLGNVYKEVCKTVTHTLDVEFCKILEAQFDGKTLLLRAGSGWKEGLIGTAMVDAGLHSQAGYALQCNQPVVVEDLAGEARFDPAALLLDHGVVSGLSVIIPGRERPFGVLGAHTLKRRKFKNEDVHFLESVAHILSAAIQRGTSESAIQKSEAWLRNLVATTQDAVVSIDRRGCVVLFNQSAERIFGYRAEEIIGRKVNTLMAEPYAAEHDEYIERYERTGEAKAIGQIRTVTARRKDGMLFPIELSVTEIEIDENVHYAAFIRDISDKVELQKQLVESEKLAAIGGTAAKIGHEIANPLNGIYLTLQLIEQRLSREASVDERVTRDVLRIKKEIGRLNQLVQEFRSLSRQQDYHFRPMNLAPLLNEALDLQQLVLEARSIVISRHIADDLPGVTIDEDRMKQALLNLIKNAGEAMPNGGTLTVTVTASDGSVAIHIKDTGIGIAPGSDVFQPFFTTKKEGTGLGLIIVRQIILAHRGTLVYDSEPGEGTTFHITLPRMAAASSNR
jgi:two-component system, LuxR family, sensor kinase FixL